MSSYTKRLDGLYCHQRCVFIISVTQKCNSPTLLALALLPSPKCWSPGFSLPTGYCFCQAFVSLISWPLFIDHHTDIISHFQIMNIRSIYNYCEARAGDPSVIFKPRSSPGQLMKTDSLAYHTTLPSGTGHVIRKDAKEVLRSPCQADS